MALTSPPAPLGVRVPLWLLTLLSFSGTVGMYIFLPALPYAARALSASASEVQLTISLYLIGMAAGQLVYGPLSDRFGRRPVLLGGLTLYTLAGVATVLAPGAELLNAARLVQGFGGSSGLVLGRAMARDTAPPGDAARRLALLNLMVSAGPGLAPVLGAAVAEAWGWRAVLVALALLGSVNLLLCGWLLPETRPLAEAGNADWRRLRQHYGALACSRSFLCYALGGGLATTAVYGLFSSAPFIFVQQLHRPVHEAGVFLTLLVSGLWFGSVIAVRLLRRHAAHDLLVWANRVGLLMALVFLALAVQDRLSLASVAGLMFVYALGVGVAAPTALAQAVNVNPAVVGTASGIYGFSQMAVGALCSALVGLGSNPALSAALLLVLAGLVSQGTFQVAARDAAPPARH